MLRRIRYNRLLRLSSLSRWCHANKDSACTTEGEEKVSLNKSESTQGSETVSKSNTVDPQLQNETPESEQKVLELLESAATYSDAKNKDWATLPYPSGVKLSNEPPVERSDPTDSSIILFPGQGTIQVGMIQKYLSYPKVKEMFEYASELINYNLLKLCLKGPKELLNRTDYNQVATVVCSLAALEKLEDERPNVFKTCVGVVGYSVGELTALIFSGAISFEDGIRLVSARGNAMLQASKLQPQGMLAITLDRTVKLHKVLESAKQWALNNGVEDPVCQVAIYLYTQGKILGGHDVALKYIETNAKAFHLKNVRRLPVSGAFHTPLMAPALPSYKKALDNTNIKEPRVAVYSNYTGYQHNNPQSIKKQLMKQVTGSVKWEQCMHFIFSRPSTVAFPRTFDVGSQGRMKMILSQTNVQASKSCFVY